MQGAGCLVVLALCQLVSPDLVLKYKDRSMKKRLVDKKGVFCVFTFFPPSCFVEMYSTVKRLNFIVIKKHFGTLQFKTLTGQRFLLQLLALISLL